MKGRAETQIRGKPGRLFEINPCGKERAKRSDKCTLFMRRTGENFKVCSRIPGTPASLWQSAAQGGATDSYFRHYHLPPMTD